MMFRSAIKALAAVVLLLSPCAYAALCTPGTYSGTGSDPCTDCAAGTYASGTGSTSCSNCLAGTYSAAAASSCMQCAAGTYSLAVSASCTPCPAGSYSAAGADSCISCPIGKYAPSPGAAQCMNCPLGSTSMLGATECTVVDLGVEPDLSPGADDLSVSDMVAADAGTTRRHSAGCNYGAPSSAPLGAIVILLVALWLRRRVA